MCSARGTVWSALLMVIGSPLSKAPSADTIKRYFD